MRRGTDVLKRGHKMKRSTIRRINVVIFGVLFAATCIGSIVALAYLLSGWVLVVALLLGLPIVGLYAGSATRKRRLSPTQDGTYFAVLMPLQCDAVAISDEEAKAGVSGILDPSAMGSILYAEGCRSCGHKAVVFTGLNGKPAALTWDIEPPRLRSSWAFGLFFVRERSKDLPARI